MAPRRQFHCDGGCNSSLADAALSHRHNDTMPGLLNLMEEVGQRESGERSLVGVITRFAFGGRCMWSGGVDGAETGNAHGGFRQEWEFKSRQSGKGSGHACNCLLPSPFQRDRRRILAICCDKDRIQQELLAPHPKHRQFGSRPLRFAQRGGFRSAHQVQRRACRVGERFHTFFVEGFL